MTTMIKPNRREFLSAAAVAPALGPILLGLQVKTTLRGEIVFKIQGPPDIPEYKVPDGAPQPSLPLYNPTNIAIAANGDLYVADGYGSYYINRYNSKGQYLGTFGGRGSDPGQL